MNMIYHKSLTKEHWYKFSLMRQLANIGMDIERTIQWRDKGDADLSRQAFGRALELIDLTIGDPKLRRAARREILRTREALVDYFVYDNEYKSCDKIWQDYFYQFNYAAALERGR